MVEGVGTRGQRFSAATVRGWSPIMSWMLYAALKRRSSTSRRSSFWKRNVKVPTLAAKSAARMGHPFVWLMARSGAWASCRGNAKGTMVEGAGTEEPEILRGDRQGLKPECELMLYAALKRRSSTFAPVFHFRADLLLGRGKSESPPCRGKRDKDGASIGVVNGKVRGLGLVPGECKGRDGGGGGH
jgi:hypothetical protein